MVDMPYDEGSESITRSEHISPIKTGDNIEAKRVAQYVWNGSAWQRATPASGGGSATVVGVGPLGQNNVAFDSLTYTATSATVDTYQYYSGGVTGTLTATLTITYTDSTHATLVSAVRT